MIYKAEITFEQFSKTRPLPPFSLNSLAFRSPRIIYIAAICKTLIIIIIHEAKTKQRQRKQDENKRQNFIIHI